LDSSLPERASRPWHFTLGEGPLVAAALHEGSQLREEAARLMALTPAERLREEDPYTAGLTAVAPTRIVVNRSRFEVDLNRPREAAIYLRPELAWGLQVWKEPPEPAVIERSLALYDAFYQEARALLTDLSSRFGKVVVLDIHSYNHRREGPDAEPADPAGHPEVNIGTGTMDRANWAPLVDRFMEELSGSQAADNALDVRENVKFQGGQFPRWIHENFAENVCAIAIEFKKTFMDEWTGQLDPGQWQILFDALRGCVPGLLEELKADP